jgi:hypothetical protein
VDVERTLTMMGWPLIGSLAGGLVPVLLTLYVVARWRSATQDGGPDGQLGLKLAFALFRWIGLQLVLAGLSIGCYAGFAGGSDKETGLRIAAAVILPGLLIGGANEVAYRRTNHRERPIVGRMMAGVSLIQTGVVATIALVIACQLSLLRDPDAEAVGTAWSVAAVYGIAWLAQGWAVARPRP